MTVFTVDVSSNQRGLKVAQIKAQGYAGMMARCSIGSNYDSEYWRFMNEAKALNFPFGAYHFLKGWRHTPIATQVGICVMAIKDKSIPLMLDVESDINSLPSWRDVTDFQNAIAKQGVPCKSIYLPHWYWTEIGSPDVNLPLVASSYGTNPQGHASALYPGDDRWPDAYGSRVPVLWQFGSRGTIDGYNSPVDINAYLGNAIRLVTSGLFTGWGTTPPLPPQERTEDMPYVIFDQSNPSHAYVVHYGGKARPIQAGVSNYKDSGCQVIGLPTSEFEANVKLLTQG